MPEPVFRSSEGRTPKPARGLDAADEIDTLSPEFSEADTDEIDIDQDEVDTETPESRVEVAAEPEAAVAEPSEIYEEKPPERNAVRPAAQKQAGGCAKTISMILAAIALSVVAVLIVLIYFGFYYQPTDLTF